MAVDFNLPTVATSYTAFPTQIIENIDAALQQLSVGSPSNVPTNAIKWDATANRWKKYNGSAYVDLTGTYDLNANVSVNQLDLGDSEKIRLGAGQYLQIFHDQTLGHSFIKDTGTGNLKISAASGPVQILKGSSEDLAKFTPDGSCELYYDNAKKFETTSNGTHMYGTTYVESGFRPASDGGASLGSGSYRWYDLNISNDIKISDGGKIQLGAGPDLEIYSDGTNAFIKCPDTGNNLTLESDQHLYIKVGDGEDAVKCVNGAAVELYHNGTQQCYTHSVGLKFNDNKKIYLGTSADLQIYHDGTHSNLNNSTGNLRLQSDGFRAHSQDYREAFI